MTIEFKEWPKIARTSNVRWYLTEKIDGTNACIIREGDVLAAQSRSKIITSDDDNMGFAKWVIKNTEELLTKLPEGYNYGEWWGLGIQRNYGLKEKRFSLFNPWFDPSELPACVGAVPLLAFGTGIVDAMYEIHTTKEILQRFGSVAAPGFMKSEGVVLTFDGGLCLKEIWDK